MTEYGDLNQNTDPVAGPAVVTEHVEGKVVLKRRLGLASCISFIVGIVIGTGIFVSPKVRNTIILYEKHRQ